MSGLRTLIRRGQGSARSLPAVVTRKGRSAEPDFAGT